MILNLPKRRAIKGIDVVLQGLCDVFGEFALLRLPWLAKGLASRQRLIVGCGMCCAGGPNYRYSANQSTIKRELRLDLKGETLEAGDHLYVHPVRPCEGINHHRGSPLTPSFSPAQVLVQPDRAVDDRDIRALPVRQSPAFQYAFLVICLIPSWLKADVLGHRVRSEGNC